MHPLVYTHCHGCFCDTVAEYSRCNNLAQKPKIFTIRLFTEKNVSIPALQLLAQVKVICGGSLHLDWSNLLILFWPCSVGGLIWGRCWQLVAVSLMIKTPLQTGIDLNTCQEDEYIMVYLYSEITLSNETKELLLHPETWLQQKKLGVEGHMKFYCI